MATKKLYKATVTTTVYFVTDKTEQHELLMEAERYMMKELRANGLNEFPEPVRVPGRERPEGTWALRDYVHGSEKMPGGKQLTLAEVMQLEEDRKALSQNISALGL
jgi:hypothetical protein